MSGASRAASAACRMFAAALGLGFVADRGVAAQTAAQREAMVARAKALELPTPYVPPPGDALEHHAAGYAKVIASAVFITGLDPDFAAEHVVFFTAPP